MKDSWGPLKALAAATAVNGIGDIVLCRYLGYGITGAAWATMASQVCLDLSKVQKIVLVLCPRLKEFLKATMFSVSIWITLIIPMSFLCLVNMTTHTC